MSERIVTLVLISKADSDLGWLKRTLRLSETDVINKDT